MIVVHPQFHMKNFTKYSSTVFVVLLFVPPPHAHTHFYFEKWKLFGFHFQLSAALQCYFGCLGHAELFFYMKTKMSSKKSKQRHIEMSDTFVHPTKMPHAKIQFCICISCWVWPLTKQPAASKIMFSAANTILDCINSDFSETSTSQILQMHAINSFENVGKLIIHR